MADTLGQLFLKNYKLRQFLLIPNVTSRHNNIDEAMRLGFNWSIGPF